MNVKGKKPLLNERWEAVAKMMVHLGCSCASAWRRSALDNPTAKTCANASYRLRNDSDFMDRYKYLKMHPEESDAELNRNYEKLEGRLWSIIESSGVDASKDSDVIRAIGELAKLRERMFQGEQAAADNAVVASTLTRILNNGIDAVCPDDETLGKFVESLSEVLKRGVSIQASTGEFITHSIIKEGENNDTDEAEDGLGSEGQPEGECNDTAEGI